MRVWGFVILSVLFCWYSVGQSSSVLDIEDAPSPTTGSTTPSPTTTPSSSPSPTTTPSTSPAPTTTTVPPRNCTNEEFTCADGACIPLDACCNFFVDCPGYDFSDEDGCVESVCSFENDNLCGWGIIPAFEEEELVFTWQAIPGKDNPGEHNPPIDHTMGQNDTLYLFADSAKGKNTSEITRLFPTATFGRTSETCRLTLWYWLSGEEPGSLVVLKGGNGSEPYEIWETEGNQGDEWRFASVPVGNLQQRNLSVEAHRGEIYKGAAALDDFMFEECRTPSYPPAGTTCKELELFQCKNGMCTTTSVVCDYAFDCPDNSDESPAMCLQYKFSCDFEIGFCKDWQQDNGDTTNWALLDASSEVEGTSPPSDHTEGTFEGHYILLDTSPAVENITAVGRIHSPVLMGDNIDCTLRIWYQFTGDDSGTLKIYARVSYYDDGMRLVVEHKSPKDLWTKDTLTFGAFVSNQRYQVVIEGTNSQYGHGNLVIDDLSMTPDCEISDDQTLPGQQTTSTPAPICPRGQLTCGSGECYYPSDVCNFHNDCIDGTDEVNCAKGCDFERDGDLCGWFEDPSSSIHWTRKGFPADEPGPDTDHNQLKSTFDLCVSKSDGTKGHEAILQTTTFSGVNKSCVMEAWYYMANDWNDSSLSLSIQDETASIHIWEGSITSSWEKISVSISSARNFLMQFLAIMGKGKAYTALDDIKFNNCAVQTKECSSTEFQCLDDHNCIPYYLVCDANPNCRDETDEEGCNLKRNQGDCNFDQPDWIQLCEWEQFSDDDLDWLQADHSNDSTIGPFEDHTFGEGGYYLYLGNSSEPGKVASVAPAFEYPASSGICYIRYWYYIHDNSEEEFDLGALKIYLQDEDASRWLIQSHAVRRGPEWLEDILLVSSDKKFRVIFEATTGDPDHTYIALDDVSVTRECVSGIPPTNATCLPHEFECKSGECIPQRLHCDDVDDCQDASDEAGCPIEPILICKQTEMNCGDQKTCVAAALLCDGIKDCPNGADELECPDGTPCPTGSIYCSDPDLDPPCMGADTLCDGNVTCQTYSADESLCGQCPDQLCLSGGTCLVEEDHAPTCQCQDGYTGNRCESGSGGGGGGGGGGLSAGAITGIVLGSLAFVAIVAGLTYYFVKKHKEASSSSSGYLLNRMK